MSKLQFVSMYPSAVFLAAALTAFGSTAEAQALAQAFRAEALQTPAVAAGPLLVEGTKPSGEVIALLSGLAKIESDLQLGMLFLADGLTNPEGSHFGHPRAETYPALKDALARAGIVDFEAQLVTLEAGGDSATVTTAYTEAIAAIMGARSVLRPSAQDMLLSIVDQTRAVVGEINPEGPTELANYQDAWAMLLVARNQLDLLVRGQDAAVAEAAMKMALVFDDIILSMPDPVASAPVAFDRAPLIEAIAALEGFAGSV